MTVLIHSSSVNLIWHVLMSSIYFLAGREIFFFSDLAG